MVDSVSVRFKNARVEKILLNIRIQWNGGTACVSEYVLKTLACRGLRVGPSKGMFINSEELFVSCQRVSGFLAERRGGGWTSGHQHGGWLSMAYY